MKVKILIVLSLNIIILMCSCSSTRIEHVGRVSRTETMINTVLTGKNISYKTRQFLITNALMHEYIESPEKVIKKLAEYIDNPDGTMLSDYEGVRFSIFVLMELCMYQARNGLENDSLMYWMSVCFYSYKYIFDKTIDPPINKYYTMLGLVMALHFYNISLAEITDYLINKKDLWESKPVFKTVMGEVKFTKLRSDLLWSPKLFKKFIISLDYMPKDFLAHSFNTGIGVPMIGTRTNGGKYNPTSEFSIFNLTYPFVFVLKFNNFNFDKGYIKAEPEFLGAFKNEFVDINNIEVPLYKDFSVMIGHLLSTKKYIKGIQFMFDPGQMGSLQELYLIAPFDLKKIPVILVHGLMSEPRTWADALNVLLSNKIIRENYQFLLYSYPTGLPVIYNAASFRKDLIEFKQRYDPDNNNPKMDYTVLIGHSMGGLLSNLIVQDSKGSFLLDKFLEEDISKTDLSEGQKGLLNSIFVFDALPFIRRTVFIGSPHRGAEMATYLYSKIGSYLIAMPTSLSKEFMDIVKGTVKSRLSKNLLALDIPTGIDDLIPGQGIKLYTIDLPHSENVTLYSIIGDKDEAGKKGGTDGVVPYKSSHLKDVKREVIIKSGHDELKKAACIKEIMTILLENLEDYKSIHHETKSKKEK